MRVNMDSSIVSDPRFKLVAADLGRTWREVVGSCFLVWLACYERRSARLPIEEADLAAEINGFSAALSRRGLADIDVNDVVIHGVKARISFLNKQSALASRGGKSSGKSTRSKTPRPEAIASGDPEATPEAYSHTHTHTHTPDHTLAPAQDQDQALATLPRSLPAPAPPAAIAGQVRGGVTVDELHSLVASWGWSVQGIKPKWIPLARQMQPFSTAELEYARQKAESEDGAPNAGLLLRIVERERKATVPMPMVGNQRAGPRQLTSRKNLEIIEANSTPLDMFTRGRSNASS